MTSTTTKPTYPPFFERKGDRLKLNLHPGQTRTWDSLARFVFMLASTQGGKTCFGPHWLLREIETHGAGDYLAVTATFPLLNNKMLPEFLKLFRDIYKLGTYRDSTKVFEFKAKPGDIAPTRVIFGSAANPESIESATAKAAWLDEVGQIQFRRGSWEAVLRRLSLAEGRVLGTTTLYGLGWMKTEIYDKWKAGDPDFDVIQFNSLSNPAFPQAEFERAKRTLPRWKFNLFYLGQYDRPAGLVYDCFDEAHCVVRRSWHKPPERYHCFVGHDFGPDNTAAIWYAQDPDTGLLWAYREYRAGGLSSAQHAKKIIALSEGENIMRRVGGSIAEEGYRDAYTAAGWPITGPRRKFSVEEGIDRVYGWHKDNRILVFDDLDEYVDEKMAYSRKLDDNYEPTLEIDDKQKFHLMDAERYIIQDFAPELAQVMQETPVTRIEGAPSLR